MARKYMTTAHTRVRRRGGFSCPRCDRVFKNAKYEGEYCFIYDKQGREKWIAVFVRCRCGALNEASLDLTDDDGFLSTVEEVTEIPQRAVKITTAPAMAEEQ